MFSRKYLPGLLLLLLLAIALLGFAYAHSLSQEVVLNVGSLGDEEYVPHGFYARENIDVAPYRWTSGDALLVFPNRGHLPLSVALSADAPRPEGYPQPQVSILANGQIVQRFTAESGIRDYTFEYLPRFPWPSDLSLKIQSETFAPPGDPRELGLLVSGVALRPVRASSFFVGVWFILLSLLPGVVLVLTAYAVIRLGFWPERVALTFACLVIALVGFGAYHDLLSMDVLGPLALLSLVVASSVFAVRRLGLRERLVDRAVDWLGAVGSALGMFTSRVFTIDFVRLQLARLAGWADAHRWDLAIGGAFFVLAVIIRLPYFLEMPHVTDEFREVQIAAGVADGTNYPLFFSTTDYLGVVHSYLLGFFLRLVGLSLYAPRLYVVGMGALTVVLVYWLAREMGSRSTAVIAGGLMLFSPMHIFISSHVAWMNSTTPVFCLLLFIAFYRGVVRESGVELALSGFLAGVALQTHPTVALFFPGMVIWYFWQQRIRGRSFRQSLRRPSLYVALALFLLSYGNIIWYNSHGRLHVLAAAQRRDSMGQNPLNVWVYLNTLRDLLQNLLSSMSGTFEFQFSGAVFLRPAMLIYGLWFAAGLVYAGLRRNSFVLLLVMPSLLLLPLVNQNWTLPDKSRYVAPIFALCYILMAQFLAYVADRIQRSDKFRTRTQSLLGSGLVIFASLALIVYPLVPLFGFYSAYQDSEWSSRSLLRATEILRNYQQRGLTIYVDADIRHLSLPIVGSNLLKSLEYLLFLDGTQCRVIWFDPEQKPPRTFNHEVEYVRPADLEIPSVLVLVPGTFEELVSEHNLPLHGVPDFGADETRFGLYGLGAP